MTYEEQTKDITGDIRVNTPNSLSSLSDGGACWGSAAALGAPSHGQLPYRQMKTQQQQSVENIMQQPCYSCRSRKVA